MNDLDTQIDAIRKELGPSLLILGHAYQRASILRHADVVGDSLELSRRAAAEKQARKIVFCGVRFMAESADILTAAEQEVYMPETSAGCPMADMATAERMESAWRNLNKAGGDWIPVVYVNSSAEVKACCGRLGGSTCTSSNAPKVFRWAFEQGKKVFFLPDQHLGVNTAFDIGIPDDEVLVYDPLMQDGGLDADRLRRARVVVWKGFCIVHKAFTKAQVEAVRQIMPYAKIIVHPETPREVVRLCDAHGSTSQIIQYVEKMSAGSTVVIGTEINLIERLAAEHRGRLTIKALQPSVCANMAKTNLKNLLHVLQSWPETSRIRVPESSARDARTALQRMLDI
jgi:quinolinate synthase